MVEHLVYTEGVRSSSLLPRKTFRLSKIPGVHMVYKIEVFDLSVEHLIFYTHF